MIPLTTLRYLANQKQKDAEVLFRNNRNAGAIYLMGYALELSFKRKISQTFGFIDGFPESVTDFNTYNAPIARLAVHTEIALTQLRQIKNHDLNMLVIFSGTESIIMDSYYDDWLKIKDWNPENRYKRQHFTNDKAGEFIISAKRILKQII